MRRRSSPVATRTKAVVVLLSVAAAIVVGLDSRDASDGARHVDSDAADARLHARRDPSASELAQARRSGGRRPRDAASARLRDALPPHTASSSPPSPAGRSLPAPAIKPMRFASTGNGSVSPAGTHARSASPTGTSDVPDAGWAGDVEASASFDPTFSAETVVGNAQFEDYVGGVAPTRTMRR